MASASASAAPSMPTWDLEIIFPSFDSAEYRQTKAAFVEGIANLESLLAQHGLDKAERQAIDQAVAAFEALVPAFNEVRVKARKLSAFLYGHTTTDSRDEKAQAEESEFRMASIPLGKIDKRFVAWIGAQDVEALIASSPLAADHAFMLRKGVEDARHLMSGPEEALASDLAPTGSNAWSKLHGNVSSQLEVVVKLPGGERKVPMSALRTLALDADREVRKAAYEAELAKWEEVEVVMAASMNGVKGETLTLCKKRGWESPLDYAVFNANIDRLTLDAMMTAARESFPDFRRYLQAKAKLLGLERCAFYDIFAPVGGGGREWSYTEAERFVARHFRGYTDKLGDFAERSYAERWIDWEPRPGKRDGAYCMRVEGDVSRVFMNFKPSFNWVSTLAHELGHAYHNLCLSQRTPLQQNTPMTLAETASIFCETIIKRAALEEGSPEEQREILESSLQGSCQVVVDITSRFLFEERLFEKRAARELSAREMCDLMRQAQLDTYGDGLDPEALHPYMWAAKPHYYGSTFYNFPYMFGLLFGLGLFAQYQASPDGFAERYDDLLSSTGLDDAATLAGRFGIDIRTPDFWRASLDQIRVDIDRFVALTG